MRFSPSWPARTKTIRLWDVANGRELVTFQGYSLGGDVFPAVAPSAVSHGPEALALQDWRHQRHQAVAGRQETVVACVLLTRGSVTGTTGGTLDILNNGVDVTLNPASGAPGSGFQLTVTNTGTVTDMFDLSLAWPAALVARPA